MGPSSHFPGGGDVAAYEAFETSFGSPADPTSSKARVAARPVSAMETPTMPATTTHAFSNPSHPYDLYPQQMGFVPGALANTLALNNTFDPSIDSGLGSDSQDDLADFGVSDGFFPDDFFAAMGTINPMATLQQTGPSTTPMAGIGRVYPGAHQAQALAVSKAHAEKMKQQAIIQQHQRQQQQQQQSQPQPQFRQQLQQQFDPQFQQQQRQRQQPQQQQQFPLPTTFDPSRTNQINSILDSLRIVRPAILDNADNVPSQSFMKGKKDHEDMDPDELLLASEEGKKLSSKERRQLRNKVSARAFRCRRKDYMAHLEGLIHNKDKRIAQLQTAHDTACVENEACRKFIHQILSSPQGAAFLAQVPSNTVPNALLPKPEPQPSSHEPSISDSQSYTMLSPMPPADSADFPSMFMDPNDAFEASETRI